tara:strand:+ start:90879 stop:94067 length:3189 start_codon:yes stop_codon:yes gene_type:complete
MPTHRLPQFVVVLSLGVLLVASVSQGSANDGHGEDDGRGESDISFSQDVRPILSDHCFACHGPDAETREADLRLDSLESATENGAIVAGDVDASELFARITSDDGDLVMPPPEFDKPLSVSQQATLRRWIESGAPYETHWAFAAPVRPSVPAVPSLAGKGTAHPLDAFLQQKISEAGLTPSPPADKRTLIRRATLDLTGLPPTPDEIDAFLDDTSSNAYEKLMDRLFSRATYGEHMARYWLDLARYADTHGLHLDNERSMWPYRDWVVRAFNQNLAFDEFTRWQLAGDLLEDSSREQQIASGFNRCNVTTSEGGSINEEWVFRYAVDRTTTTAEVWMGLTAGCAVCHDHKFDPISAHEYYSLYSFFHSAADPAMDGNKIDTPPIVKLYSDEQESKVQELNRRLAAVNKRIQSRLDAFVYKDPAEQNPAPEPDLIDTIWFEDAFPQGAKTKNLGGPLTLVSKQESADKQGAGNRPDAVFSGEKALRRKAEQLEQDFYNSGAKPFVVPSGGKIFAYCYLDPDDLPDAIMVQIHTDTWEHRAVWGQQAKIPFGKIATDSKRRIGDLPDPGQWVRLEFTPRQVGLKANDKVTGFAFTQFGGTVTWDHLGVRQTLDKAKDATWSWKRWKGSFGGKNVPSFPDHLRSIVRAKQPDKWTQSEREEIFDQWLRNVYGGTKPLLGQLAIDQDKIETQIAELEKTVPVTFVMADLPEPRESFVMVRGQYDNPGEQVTRDVPSFLPPLNRPSDGRMPNRLDLANWLVSGEHPLTARVTVNRFWQQLFGTGLVRTSGDFGSQGDPPSHPELLDYLAVEFVDSGWDVQRLLRLMMTSHAYRQSSVVTKQHLDRDPSNRLLARAPRLRLDAEVLRDQTLFISGLLVQTIGGEPVKPYQPPNIWEPVGFGRSNTRYYDQDHGDALYRRSLYTFLKRTAPPPFMSTFDAPNREQSCSARQRSNTPMQALQLMNDIQHVEAARHFAARIIREGGASPAKRVRWAWTWATGRPPRSAERDVAIDMLRMFQDRYRQDDESAKALTSYGESDTDDAIEPDQLAAYTMLANLLLNLDETVTKN